MTENDIVIQLAKHTDERRFPWQLATSFIYSWESDFWTMTSGGETREFEIKISRSDYFVDQKKDKHKECNGANYFYYVCPTDMIRKDEVDKKYGLIYVNSDTKLRRPVLVKKPQRLNDNKFEKWELLANKMYWKFRDLWRDKYLAKEITRDEYFEGFNISILEEEQSLTPLL